MEISSDKKLSSPVYLGIDTSNYKTSCAVVDSEGNILFNHQGFLDVKQGERGLRQSDAFFQHVNRLPDIIDRALTDEIRDNIAAISVSTRPRPVEGSYMPVFNAGYSAARNIAAALNKPLYCFSHQEGHIEAVRYYSDMRDTDPVVCFHFSGGTTEAVIVDRRADKFELIGGSRDLAYGQVLDRVGVALGYAFPAGQELDRIAISAAGFQADSDQDFFGSSERNDGKKAKARKNLLTAIKVNEGWVNLSGIETQAQTRIASSDKNILVYDLMSRVAQSIAEMTEQISRIHGVHDFIFAGGVSSSSFVREYIYRYFSKEIENNDIKITFGDPVLSTDNAVGIALLGMKALNDERADV